MHIHSSTRNTAPSPEPYLVDVPPRQNLSLEEGTELNLELVAYTVYVMRDMLLAVSATSAALDFLRSGAVPHMKTSNPLWPLK